MTDTRKASKKRNSIKKKKNVTKSRNLWQKISGLHFFYIPLLLSSLNIHDKGMKRSVHFLIAATLAVSCGDPVFLGIPYGYNTGSGGTQGGDSQSKSLYITGIEFPDGHNWYPEVGGGTVEATLFLMKDGKRIVETPTGDSNLVTLDADRHWCHKGHLYSVYYTGTETVIKRDGKEAVRLSGTGNLISLYQDGEDLHTLSSTGRGFVYRINGTDVTESGYASVINGFHKDMGNIIFTYREHISSSSGTSYMHFYSENGIVHEVDVGKDVFYVESMVINEGQPAYVARIRDTEGCTCIAGSRSCVLKSPDNLLLQNMTIIDIRDDRMLIAGKELQPQGILSFILWDHSAVVASEKTSYVYYDTDGNGGLYYLAIPRNGDTPQKVMTTGREIGTLPEGYGTICPNGFCVTDKGCCVAAYDYVKSCPVIWTEGNVQEYSFNGFFTGVWYQ